MGQCARGKRGGRPGIGQERGETPDWTPPPLGRSPGRVGRRRSERKGPGFLPLRHEGRDGVGLQIGDLEVGEQPCEEPFARCPSSTHHTPPHTSHPIPRVHGTGSHLPRTSGRTGRRRSGWGKKEGNVSASSSSAALPPTQSPPKPSQENDKTTRAAPVARRGDSMPARAVSHPRLGRRVQRHCPCRKPFPQSHQQHQTSSSSSSASHPQQKERLLGPRPARPAHRRGLCASIRRLHPGGKRIGQWLVRRSKLTHPPTYPSTYLPTHLSMFLSSHPPIHEFTHPPAYLRSYHPTHPPTHPPTHLQERVKAAVCFSGCTSRRRRPMILC